MTVVDSVSILGSNAVYTRIFMLICVSKPMIRLSAHELDVAMLVIMLYIMYRGITGWFAVCILLALS